MVMKKKKKLLITATALSTLLVVGTSIPIFASNDGYELYKQAMKNTHKVKSANLSFEAHLKDNGEFVQSVDLDTKYNGNEDLGQAEVAVETAHQKMDFTVYYQDHDVLIQNDEQETNYVIEGKERTAEEKEELFKKHHDPELLSLMEKVFDVLTLPTHDDFVIGDKNGAKTISADLTHEEIPSVIQQASQYIVKKMLQSHENARMSTIDYPFLKEELTVQSPVLTDNIKLEHVKIKAGLTEDGMIEDQSIFVKVSGNDKNGTKHVLEYALKMDYSNINETELKPVDFSTYGPVVLDSSQFRHHKVH